MKILVVSDTHGRLSRVRSLIARNSGITHLFHLGDMEEDARTLQADYPGIKVETVRGNNEWFSSLPLTLSLTVEGVSFLLTHGHTYKVKQGLSHLRAAASEHDFVLFGHTHERCEEKAGSCVILNPSSGGGWLIEGRDSYQYVD